MKRCSTSLIISGIQIEPQWDTTSHLSKCLLSKRQQITNTLSVGLNWHSHDKNSMVVSESIKNTITIPSSNSYSGYLAEEIKNTNLKRCMHANVICNFIYSSQNTEAT